MFNLITDTVVYIFESKFTKLKEKLFYCGTNFLNTFYINIRFYIVTDSVLWRKVHIQKSLSEVRMQIYFTISLVWTSGRKDVIEPAHEIMALIA